MKVSPYLPHKAAAPVLYCNQPFIVGPKETPERWRERFESFSAESRGEWKSLSLAAPSVHSTADECGNVFDSLHTIPRRMGMQGVRISTRPTAFPKKPLIFLHPRCWTNRISVESLDDAVLRKSARGHTPRMPARLPSIRHFGFNLGLH
jgi:histone acetyltransferase (RNA polymerase elongator complex component)